MRQNGSRLPELTEDVRQNPGKIYFLVYGGTVIDMIKRTNYKIKTHNIAYNLNIYQINFVDLVSTEDCAYFSCTG